MSGIAGVVYPEHFPVSNLIDPMLATLSHRGPGISDRQTHLQMQVGSCGHALFSNKEVIVGLDGAIYNSPQLRNDLKSHGCHFIGTTDSEIIANAYQHWGDKFLEHLQGDFALFVLDKAKKRILIARDRIGKKPLYLFQNNNYFIFASELKAILATGAVPQTPSPEAIATYLHFGYIPQDLSPVKDVNKLLPSHYLVCNQDRRQMIQSYWSYSTYFQKQCTDSPDTVITTVDHLLQDALKQRITNNATQGCLVAGGLGSASIAYYLKKTVPAENVRAFTVEFQGETAQDSQAAKEVANHLTIPHHCDVITKNHFLDDLVKIAWHLDEPVADPHIISTWQLAKSAQPFGTFFSGMGSDEIFIGHNRYTLAERKAAYSDVLMQASLPLIKRFALPLLNAIHKPLAYSILKQTRTNPWQRDFIQQNALFAEHVRNAAAPDIAKLFDPIVFLHKFHNLQQIPSTVASFLYLDVKTRLADYYILQYERLMSAHQITWHTPFLTEPLIEYLAGLFEPDKLNENDTFYILKGILKDALPESFVNRPKRTRRHFLEGWAEQPELVKLFKMLPKGSLVETGIISRKWLNAQLSSPESRRRSFHLLWSLLMLEIWFHLFINKPVTSTPPALSIQQLFSH